MVIYFSLFFIYPFILSIVKNNNQCFADGSDESSTEDDESNVEDKTSAEKAPSKETEAGAEISALVNYVQPVHFSSFENAESE